jgi:DNA-binding XRE family transcriptional regulator
MTKLNLTETELAQRWGISPKTLQRWRSENLGPSYLKLSKRVTYPVEDIRFRCSLPVLVVEAANLIRRWVILRLTHPGQR